MSTFLAFLCNSTLIQVNSVGFMDPIFETMSGVPSLPSVVPQQGSLMGRVDTFWQKLNNYIAYYIGIFYIEPLMTSTETEFVNWALNGSAPPVTETDIFEKVHIRKLFMASTTWAMETPRYLLPSTFITGPLLPNPPKPLQEDSPLASFIDSCQQFVIVSFGTTNRGGGKALHEKFLQLFLHFPDLCFVWVIHPQNVGIEGIPKNVFVQHWIPQNDLLGHPKIVCFVTHCGMNSVQEALYHGVPMIGLPVLADQYENAGRAIEKLGTGLILRIHQPAAALIAALKDVIISPSYKKQSLYFQNVVHSEPGINGTIDYIHRVVQYGAHEWLISPQLHRNVGWHFDVAGFDVHLFIFSCLFLVLYLAKTLLLFFWRLLFGSRVQKKKAD